MSYFQ